MCVDCVAETVLAADRGAHICFCLVCVPACGDFHVANTLRALSPLLRSPPAGYLVCVIVSYTSRLPVLEAINRSGVLPQFVPLTLLTQDGVEQYLDEGLRGTRLSNTWRTNEGVSVYLCVCLSACLPLKAHSSRVHPAIRHAAFLTCGHPRALEYLVNDVKENENGSRALSFINLTFSPA